jgi:hypothetical protein
MVLKKPIQLVTDFTFFSHRVLVSKPETKRLSEQRYAKRKLQAYWPVRILISVVEPVNLLADLYERASRLFW